MKHRIGFLVASGLFCLSSTASAAPNARLVYGRSAGAESCPNEETLRRAVAARVGYDPFFPHAPRTIVVTIAPHEQRLAARIQLIDEDAKAQGARQLSSSSGDCADLFESTAMAIAIAIDPRVLVGPAAPPDVAEPAPPRAPPEEPTTEPPERPAERAQPVTTAPTAPTVRSRLMLATRSGAGFEPSLAAGLFAGAAAVWQRVSLGGEIGSYLPTGAPAPTGGEARGWLASAALVPCVRFEPVALCGVAIAGRFEGSGQGTTTSQTQSSAFVAVGARPRLEVVLRGPLRVLVEAEAVANLHRATLRVGADDVWRAPLIAASFGIGVSYEIE